MLEPFPAGPLCTRKSLTSQFHSLGVKPNDILLVHSSLSSLGWVNGGAEAVVLALLDVLGETGTLVIPTQSSDNSDPANWQHPPVPEEWKATIRETMLPYNPRTTGTRKMGVIAETVRTWPSAVRSMHPQTSFTAVGPKAEELMDGHALDCALGERSPLKKLEEANARVLLLGVGFDKCTAFHLAEYRLLGAVVEENSFAVMGEEGRVWMTVNDVAVSDEGFEELGAEFERQGSVKRGKIGGGDAKLFDFADAVEFSQRWLMLKRS
jgi:aminoglycoside 3-N-acetyltransferase